MRSQKTWSLGETDLDPRLLQKASVFKVRWKEREEERERSAEEKERGEERL